MHLYFLLFLVIVLIVILLETGYFIHIFNMMSIYEGICMERFIVNLPSF